MCGLFGHVAREPLNHSVFETALASLAPRGPDNEGSYRDGALTLGHRRLSIIDLSSAGNQPMVDAQHGLVLVFNGTIYNHIELRKTLSTRGHVFKSASDSEVILKAYAEYGENCPKYLNGMFAFCVYDQKKQQLFLARDRFGIKPLYISKKEGFFAFASNTQALRSIGVDESLNTIALHHQFTLHGSVPAPHTILNGIEKLPPAHSMTVNLTSLKTKLTRYYTLDATSSSLAKSTNEWIEATHEALIKSVKKRIEIADVDVGVLLSGGLDSSLLVGLLSEAGVSNLKTFTVGFEDQPEEKGSEFEFSDPVSERFSTKHYKFEVSNSIVLETLPKAISAMSEPMFAQDAVAFYLLSEQVSKHVKVVQSGQGADEVFAGYFWYPQMHQAQGSNLERFAPYYFDRSHEEYLSMVTQDYQIEDVTSQHVTQSLEEIEATYYLNKVLAFDATSLIVDDPVKRVDNMTMAHSLEARVPFLDYQLVEVAISCPPEIKLQNGAKTLLKHIARGLIPDSVIDRKKGYFPVPALKYVRGDVLTFCKDILNSQIAQERGLYSKDYLNRLINSPDAPHSFTRLQGSKLWHMAVLELWLQQHEVAV